MAYVADLHIHSRYSRACSGQLNVPNLVEWAKYKGINVLGTGDFLHPLWLAELKNQLKEDGSGFLYQALPAGRQGDKGNGGDLVKFVLSVEIATMYSDKGKGRRLHNLIFLPDFASAETFQKSLLSRRANLASDGRPILGMSSKDLLSLVLQASEKALFVPAHAWTPWFGIFGSESGYDSLEDCFEDLSEYIYGIETGLSCYDEETEVLTNSGWKKFLDVQYSDEICTLNPETSEVQFQKPTKVQSYSYTGKMYKLKTGRVDLLVTPNHKLFVSGCDFRQQPRFFLKEAEFLINKSKRFKKDGVWIGVDPAEFVLPAIKIKHGSRYYSGERTKSEKRLQIKPWLKFFGFWIAEGWTNKGKNGDYNVCLANKDNSILSEMKGILKSFGYKVYWDQKTNITLRVRDYQLYSYLKQFGRSTNKFIPSEVKSLSKKLLEIFFEYYIKGDGHRYGRSGKGLSATTISIKLRDDLQEIALKLGMSAYYRLHNKKGTPLKSLVNANNKVYLQSADSWVIYFIRRNIHTVLPSSIKKSKYTEKWIDFDKEVFCVTVPNHVIYVRRNGIPVWCGNSDPAMNWRVKELDNRSILSFSDAHSLPNLGRESTIFAGELDSGYLGMFKDIREQKIAGTIEFYPEQGKYHYTGHRNCSVKYAPEDTKAKGVICPVCKKGLTVGVMERVEDLAEREVRELGEFREEGVVKSKAFNRPGYRMLVPLHQVIAEAFGTAPTTQKVINEYKKLVSALGGEIKILTKVSIEDIAKVSGSKIADGVDKVRCGDLVIDPGYDGVYGVVKIWGDEGNKGDMVNQVEQSPQLGLFD